MTPGRRRYSDSASACRHVEATRFPPGARMKFGACGAVALPYQRAAAAGISSEEATSVP